MHTGRIWSYDPFAPKGSQAETIQVHDQCDQIGRIFTQMMVNYFG
jgi:hypothetical protein